MIFNVGRGGGGGGTIVFQEKIYSGTENCWLRLTREKILAPSYEEKTRLTKSKIDSSSSTFICCSPYPLREYHMHKTFENITITRLFGEV